MKRATEDGGFQLGEWNMEKRVFIYSLTLRFVEAALRETLEEAGINVKLKGILRVEHSPKKSSARMR